MDTFIEQIVRKKRDNKDTLIKAGIIALIIVLVCFFVLFLGAYGLLSLSVLLSVGVIFGGFWLVSQFDVEYEYIVTNGELDVDKIIAKKKRKRLITVDAKSFEIFGRYEETVPAGNETTTILAVGGKNPDYYADFKHSKYGNVRLIFSPDQKVLEALSSRISVRARQEK